MFARQTVARAAIHSSRSLVLRLPAAQATRKYVLELRPSASSSSAAAAYTISTPHTSSTTKETSADRKAPLQAYPLKAPSPTSISGKQSASQKPIFTTTSPSPSAPSAPNATTTSSATSTATSTASTATSTTATQQQAQPPQAQADAKPAKPRRPLRPLRARKAAMTLSPSAVTELRRLLDQPTPKLIKVGVKQKGCSGLTYDLEYVDAPGKMDEVVEQDGVKLVVDSRALMSVIGSEMHWEEDLLSKKFVFRNPNIKQACGCGESFMV